MFIELFIHKLLSRFRYSQCVSLSIKTLENVGYMLEPHFKYEYLQLQITLHRLRFNVWLRNKWNITLVLNWNFWCCWQLFCVFRNFFFFSVALFSQFSLFKFSSRNGVILHQTVAHLQSEVCFTAHGSEQLPLTLPLAARCKNSWKSRKKKCLPLPPGHKGKS